jgi:N-acetylglucosamine kinase-like BadF-type ATPase
MAITMAVDGGGTKTLAILFDDELNLLGIGRSGGMNTNFESMEVVKAHLTECIHSCLDAAGVTCVDHFFMAGPGPYPEAEAILRQKAHLTSAGFETLSEGLNGVYAGLAKSRGVSVLAGTGSRVDYVDGDLNYVTGGWGAFIGDEGSGPWIGQHAVIGAIAAHDGWGPPTVLGEMILKQWELEELHGVIPKIFLSPSMRVVLASLSPLVGKAARMGDEVAISVYEQAAELLARQCLAMYRNKQLDPAVPVVIAGSAWKGAPVMLEAFTRRIQAVQPQTAVFRPLFEPIMGSVIATALKGRAALSAEELDSLKTRYAQFLCHYDV